MAPLTPSTNGGRWAPVGSVPVLYTSMVGEGALAELAYHWSQHFPLPSQPMEVHRIRVQADKTVKLIITDLRKLGVDMALYNSKTYIRTQEIGDAVAFLECDGLIVPSARWSCENLVLYTDNHKLDNDLEVVETEQIDWRAWAISNRLLEDAEN